jgi:hypothetical protein
MLHITYTVYDHAAHKIQYITTHHAPHYTHLTKLNISCIWPCSTLHAPDLTTLYINLFMLHIAIPAHASCNINRSWPTKGTPDHAPHYRYKIIFHITYSWSCTALHTPDLVLHYCMSPRTLREYIFWIKKKRITKPFLYVVVGNTTYSRLSLAGLFYHVFRENFANLF